MGERKFTVFDQSLVRKVLGDHHAWMVLISKMSLDRYYRIKKLQNLRCFINVFFVEFHKGKLFTFLYLLIYLHVYVANDIVLQGKSLI